MPSWIPLPAFCCLLLPWAFTVFHKTLGNPGKTPAQPPTRTLG
ncbi:hyaluronan and proteoglycan link protein 2, isoform CRA_a [Rattus norvegicus]|uniref:Hyaluronan and proteoglycan link protein 2, isoform CRA_a n=1 Tax=Rattus norvegicus TaxID=10116 RepID=A6J645_RAT|nr:hyaluronan and proteoglycan link protein 2, isoform CRA_a [Rattus norvegicus]EDM00744.1 hyaluronan and proteoglycan link protein 2, isoform CRA_a [Rattus norvegicus]